MKIAEKAQKHMKSGGKKINGRKRDRKYGELQATVVYSSSLL